MGAAGSATGLFGALHKVLPRGVPLRDDIWVARHRAFTIVLWLHVVGIPIMALSLGYGVAHTILETLPVAAAALVASRSSASRFVRMAAVTLGLVTSSAILVHLSGGLIEMHFHFFVVVAVVTLYQAWTPFLLAIVYVLLHHGVMGAIDPGAVFNHPAAMAHPWKWAAVHALFIAGASAAGLAAWKLNEDAQDRLTETYRTQLLKDEAYLTAQVQAQAALERSEERFRSLIQNSYEVVSVVDSDGVIDYISPAIENMLGYPPSELIGKVGFDFLHEDDVRWAREAHEHVAAASGRIRDYEIRAAHKDGSWRWLQVTLHNLCDNPAIGGLVAHIRDTTEQKQVEESTRTLEDQLRQSQKLEAVGQLAGGVAHDFNNILSVIQNYARFVIEEMDEDDPRREDVAEIITAGDRASNLVRQLLTFSRKDIIRPEIWDINEIVSEMTTMLRRTLPENVAVEVALSEEAAAVDVDRGQMEQVIMNLVVNARDAMPTGGNLRIETGRVEVDGASVGPEVALAPGHYAHMVISDEGVGMDRPTMSRVFEPFFTTKSRDSGTGLGLATVYGIVEHAGGHIFVDSEPGVGTRFDLYLPLADPAASPDVRVIEERAGRDSRGTGTTILVAEDEPGVRAVIQRILSAHGYEVLIAPSGEEALALAKEHEGKVDLLLTDLVMPKMSGVDLAAALPHLRVVYMSGYSGDVLSVQGVLGKDEHLPKPFVPSALLAKVKEALEKPPPPQVARPIGAKT